MKFLLMLISVGVESAQPIHFQPFDQLEDCERARTAIVKQVPRNPAINYVAVCAPIKNAASVDV